MLEFNRQSKTWLITGCAGFIGSNLLEKLLRSDIKVVGLDNFATGHQRNLDEVRKLVGAEKWFNFRFIEGDIRDFSTCLTATAGVDVVLHQAALGSVPRSIADPITAHAVNVTGFVNMIKAAVDNGVRRFVYASSSSVYGDQPDLPKQEHKVGNQLSPYAVTKFSNELYAKVFARTYGIETVGLRYFNVFGPRQDPDGAYAAVIPLWFKSFFKQQIPVINGDGQTSRDFCYIENVVQMNLLAGLSHNQKAINMIYNVACGEQTSLNDLFAAICNLVYGSAVFKPQYADFRQGDVRHSLADISLAKELLGYVPTYDIKAGLEHAYGWYKEFFSV